MKIPRKSCQKLHVCSKVLNKNKIIFGNKSTKYSNSLSMRYFLCLKDINRRRSNQIISKLSLTAAYRTFLWLLKNENYYSQKFLYSSSKFHSSLFFLFYVKKWKGRKAQKVISLRMNSILILPFMHHQIE